MLVFYEFQQSANSFKFEEDKSVSDKGLPLGGGVLPT